MSKFTPRPWRALKSSPVGDNIAVYDADGGLIAKVGKRGAQVTAANARLIEAAPDLYEALRSMTLAFCESEVSCHSPEQRRAMDAAITALAKVEES